MMPTDASVRDDEWEFANPYVTRHLATHAAAAGTLENLIADAGFLPYADPERLARVLPAVNYRVRPLARLYWRSLDQLRAAATPEERAAILDAVAARDEPDALALLRTDSLLPWRTLWSAGRRRPFHRRLAGHTGPAWSVALGQVAGQDVLASGSADGTVRLWDAVTGDPAATLQMNVPGVWSVAFGQAAGRDVLASGSSDGTVLIWDAVTRTPIAPPLAGHTGPVWSVAFCETPGRVMLASGSADSTIRLWDALTGEPVGIPLRHASAVRSVSFGVAGGQTVVASGSEDGTARIWDPATGRETITLTGHDGPVLSVAFGQVAGRTVLASGFEDGTARIWDPVTGRETITLTGHDGPVLSVAFGQVAGRTVLASGSADGDLRLWDPESGATLAVVTDDAGIISSVVFGRAGSRDVIASGSADGIVRIWDPVTWEPPADETGHVGSVRSLAVGEANGRAIVASGSSDGTVRIWDAATGAQAAVLTAQASPVQSVAIGEANGRAIVASGSPEGLQIWDLNAPGAAPTVIAHGAEITDLAFTEINGDSAIIIGSSDGTVRVVLVRGLADTARGTGANGGGGRELDPARSGGAPEPASRPRRATGERALAEALRETERETERPADEPDLNEGFAYRSLWSVWADPGETQWQELATIVQQSALTGDVRLLEEAAAVLRDATTAVPVSDPRRAAISSNLGVILLQLFDRNGDTRLLEEAVAVEREAAAAIPATDPYRPRVLSNLGIALQRLFEYTGDIRLLEEAVAAGRTAAAEVAADDPDRAKVVASLAIALQRLFERTGETRALQQALEAGRAAADAFPASSPGHAAVLSNLGVTILQMSERTGDIRLLEEAVAAGRTAAAEVTAGDADRARILLNLAIAMQSLFRETGQAGLLAEAADLSRAAVAASAADDPSRAAYLSGLSRVLRAQFENNGDAGTLAEAVQAGREAVAAVPAAHPARAGYLSGLGLAVRELGERAGDTDLLAEAVQLSREAVAAVPAAHPARAGYLSGLELALRALYGSTGDIDLLAEAVTAGRGAIAATPDGHASRAGYLSNLGLAEYEVYRRTGDPGALAEAVQLSREAVAATRHEHPDWGPLVSNLGLVLSAVAEISGDDSSWAEADACYLRAAQSTTATAATRVSAYRRVAARAASLGRHEQAMNALETAVSLAMLLAPRGSGDPNREYRLKLVAGLPGEAAAAAVSMGLPERALELLERARSLMTGSMTPRASDLSRLRSAHPDLARRFDELRDLLSGLDRASARSAPALGQARSAAYEEWEALTARIRATDGFAGFLQAMAGTDLAALAQEGPVAFLYASAYRCDALVLTPNPEEPVRVVPLPNLTEEQASSQAHRLADALRATSNPDILPAARITAQKDIQGILTWLWEVIAEPVLNAAGLCDAPAADEPWPRMWWCPEGVLALLPLHAAGYPDDQGNADEPSATNVPDRVISSYIAGTGHLAYARAARPARGREPALIVAVPDPPGVSVMPAAYAEARDLARIIPGAHLLPRPIRSSVLSALPAYEVMHFAGIVRTDPTDPAASSLTLYDYQTSPLTAANIASLHLPGGLAYLSACGSDEGVRLDEAFAQTGYQHLISYLWDIGDSAARRLAGDFYQRLTAGGTQPPELPSAAVALHQASRRLRSRYPGSPSLWAAIIHTGP